MARLTSHRAAEMVGGSKYDLILVAAKRARQLLNGAAAKVEWNNDNALVVALREIEEGYINKEVLDQD